MSSFTEQCPASAPFFGFIGSAAALVFASTPPTIEPLVLAFGLSALPFRTMLLHSRSYWEQSLPVSPGSGLTRRRGCILVSSFVGAAVHGMCGVSLVHNSSGVTDFGAAYGTAKSGVGIASMGVQKPDLVMKAIVPVVMAGVIGIYGLIIAVITTSKSKSPPFLPAIVPREHM